MYYPVFSTFFRDFVAKTAIFIYRFQSFFRGKMLVGENFQLEKNFIVGEKFVTKPTFSHFSPISPSHKLVKDTTLASQHYLPTTRGEFRHRGKFGQCKDMAYFLTCPRGISIGIVIKMQNYEKTQKAILCGFLWRFYGVLCCFLCGFLSLFVAFCIFL